MMWSRKLIFVLTVTALCCIGSYAQYEPTWESLDTRPLPQWYDDAKFGIFIHWGVFSVPSFGSEWFWHSWKEGSQEYIEFMENNYPPDFTYQDFARDFTASFYNPEEWAELFQSSGAKYIVLTTKHHEGYTLWPSQSSYSWNSMDVGPKRDLVGDLAAAIRSKTELKFGIYHSLFEWYNPLYLYDKNQTFATSKFVDQKTIPELFELVENYKPEVIWSDGEYEASDDYWKSKEFLAWLYSDSEVKDTVVVNDRWGKGIVGQHGDFFTFADRYNPGKLVDHKWENCMTIDTYSWGFRRNAKLSDYLSMHSLITLLAETVSCGGNLLMNIGPTKDGLITPIYEERLRGMGDWLQVNGESIYSSRPWTHQNDSFTSGVWYTKSSSVDEPALYAIVLDWPAEGSITLGDPTLATDAVVTLLGYENPLQWESTTDGVKVVLPDKAEVASEWAWVLKFTNFESS